MENIIENCTEWTPELSAEGDAHLAKLETDFGLRIPLMRELRLSLGLTQIEVAELLGVTQSNVSKIEVKGDPSLSILARMVEAKQKRLKLVVEGDDGTFERAFAVG